MNHIDALRLIAALTTALNAAMSLASNAERYRETVGGAIAEGRDLTPDELATLRDGSQGAIDKMNP